MNKLMFATLAFPQRRLSCPEADPLGAIDAPRDAKQHWVRERHPIWLLRAQSTAETIDAKQREWEDQL